MVQIPVILLTFKEQLFVKQWLLLAQFKGLSAQFEFINYVFQKGKWSLCQDGVFHVQEFYLSPHLGSRAEQGSADASHGCPRARWDALVTSPSLQKCADSP